MNRFEVCQLVSKGVKATHKTGGRFEDTINDALEYLGNHDSNHDAMYPKPVKAPIKSLEPAA
jgi:hypothetical protein